MQKSGKGKSTLVFWVKEKRLGELLIGVKQIVQ